jgi:hypothetical protein
MQYAYVCICSCNVDVALMIWDGGGGGGGWRIFSPPFFELLRGGGGGGRPLLNTLTAGPRSDDCATVPAAHLHCVYTIIYMISLYILSCLLHVYFGVFSFDSLLFCSLFSAKFSLPPHPTIFVSFSLNISVSYSSFSLIIFFSFYSFSLTIFFSFSSFSLILFFTSNSTSPQFISLFPPYLSSSFYPPFLHLLFALLLSLIPISVVLSVYTPASVPLAAQSSLPPPRFVPRANIISIELPVSRSFLSKDEV